VPFDQAKTACANGGSAFSIPRTGYANSVLNQAAGTSGPIWLKDRRHRGG
jgi:hypothetical protein